MHYENAIIACFSPKPLYTCKVYSADLSILPFSFRTSVSFPTLIACSSSLPFLPSHFFSSPSILPPLSRQFSDNCFFFLCHSFQFPPFHLSFSIFPFPTSPPAFLSFALSTLRLIRRWQNLLQICLSRSLPRSYLSGEKKNKALIVQLYNILGIWGSFDCSMIFMRICVCGCVNYFEMIKLVCQLWLTMEW